jgi:FkbM family methyltransferase
MINSVKDLWRRAQRHRQQAQAKREAILDLASWTTRDEAALSFYKQLIPPETICFDIGGNVGNRAKIFARLAKKVIVLEPQKSCVEILTTMLPMYPNVTIIPQAVGPHPGELKLYVSDNSMLSTASTEWINDAKKSNRFGEDAWKASDTVEMTTISDLIANHGTPSFIKVDVEGFELDVLRGLKTQVPAVSYEFVPERLDSCFQCLQSLENLGPVECNFGLNETLGFKLPRWLPPAEFKNCLNQIEFARSDFGDVYVRAV